MFRGRKRPQNNRNTYGGGNTKSDDSDESESEYGKRYWHSGGKSQQHSQSAGGRWDTGSNNDRNLERAQEGNYNTKNPNRNLERAQEGNYNTKNPNRNLERAQEGNYNTKNPSRNLERAQEGNYNRKNQNWGENSQRQGNNNNNTNNNNSQQISDFWRRREGNRQTPITDPGNNSGVTENVSIDSMRRGRNQGNDSYNNAQRGKNVSSSNYQYGGGASFSNRSIASRVSSLVGVTPLTGNFSGIPSLMSIDTGMNSKTVRQPGMQSNFMSQQSRSAWENLATSNKPKGSEEMVALSILDNVLKEGATPNTKGQQYNVGMLNTKGNTWGNSSPYQQQESQSKPKNKKKKKKSATQKAQDMSKISDWTPVGTTQDKLGEESTEPTDDFEDLTPAHKKKKLGYVAAYLGPNYESANMDTSTNFPVEDTTTKSASISSVDTTKPKANYVGFLNIDVLKPKNPSEGMGVVENKPKSRFKKRKVTKKIVRRKGHLGRSLARSNISQVSTDDIMKVAAMFPRVPSKALHCEICRPFMYRCVQTHVTAYLFHLRKHEHVSFQLTFNFKAEQLLKYLKTNAQLGYVREYGPWDSEAETMCELCEVPLAETTDHMKIEECWILHQYYNPTCFCDVESGPFESRTKFEEHCLGLDHLSKEYEKRRYFEKVQKRGRDVLRSMRKFSRRITLREENRAIAAAAAAAAAAGEGGGDEAKKDDDAPAGDDEVKRVENAPAGGDETRKEENAPAGDDEVKEVENAPAGGDETRKEENAPAGGDETRKEEAVPKAMEGVDDIEATAMKEVSEEAEKNSKPGSGGDRSEYRERRKRIEYEVLETIFFEDHYPLLRRQEVYKNFLHLDIRDHPFEYIQLLEELDRLYERHLRKQHLDTPEGFKFGYYNPSVPPGGDMICVTGSFECVLCDKEVDLSKQSVIDHCSSEEHYDNLMDKKRVDKAWDTIEKQKFQQQQLVAKGEKFFKINEDKFLKRFDERGLEYAQSFLPTGEEPVISKDGKTSTNDKKEKVIVDDSGTKKVEGRNRKSLKNKDDSLVDEDGNQLNFADEEEEDIADDEENEPMQGHLNSFFIPQ